MWAPESTSPNIFTVVPNEDSWDDEADRSSASRWPTDDVDRR